MKRYGYTISKNKKLLFFAATCLLYTLNIEAQQASWSWKIPVNKYRNLDLSQRASVDRAQDLLVKGEAAERKREEQEAITSYRAAAAEWKRFCAEFFDAPESAIAHCMFMQAYSTHMSKSRMAAIKMYTEVCDLYIEDEDIRVASLFWRGQAYMDSGDTGKAIADWTEIVKDEVAMDHLLAGVALERLADFMWKSAKWDEAEKYWDKIVKNKNKMQVVTVNTAYRSLMSKKALQGQWNEVTALVEDARDNSKGRADLAGNFYWSAWFWVYNDWRSSYYEKRMKGKEEIEKRLVQFRKELVSWYERSASWFIEAGREWDHSLALFERRCLLDASKKSELAAAMAKSLKESAVEADEKEKRAKRLIDLFKKLELYIEARIMLELIPDQVNRLWTGYQIEDSAKEYKASLAILDQLEKNSDPDVVKRAKKTRAYVYKDKTHEYDKAVPIFIDLAEPPETLWALQDCYRKMGKKNEAQQTLTEIASMFPPEAAKAMFQKAEYYRQDDAKKEAIAHYRRIMNHPEWKKSPESSRSHQALEKLGIDSGGAVIHDVY